MNKPNPESSALQVDSANETKLVRGLGLSQSIALNIANMVGIGPFITIPLFLAAMHGPQALIAWVIAAVLVICDGLVWSELGAALPGSGGTYHFLREIFGKQTNGWGRMLPFLFVWQFLVSGTMEIASGYIGAVPYLTYIFPELSNVLSEWHIPGGTNTLAAAGCLIVTWMLSRRIEVVGWVGLVLCAGTLLTVATVIISGLMNFNASIITFPPDAFQINGTWFNGLGAAMLIAIYDYFGYYNICHLGDEVQNPGRTIPRAVIASVVIVAAIYLIMNLSIIAVVPWQEAMESKQIAALFMETLYGRRIAVVFTWLVLWTVLACMFSITLGYSRIPFAAALNGDFLPLFAYVHPTKRYPVVSLWALGILTAIFCYVPLDIVIETAVTVRILVQFVAQIIGLHVLRTTRPEIVMPFRMWLYPLPSLIALVGWLFVLRGTRTELLWAVAAVIVSGIAVYSVVATKRVTIDPCPLLETQSMARTSNYPFGLTLGGLLIGSLVFAVTSVAVMKPSSVVRTHERIVDDQARLPEKIVVVTDEMAAASTANGQFAVDLYQRLAETNPGENLLLSPFSISLALSMVAEGAVDETRDQLTDVLRFARGDLTRIHHGQRGLQGAVVPDVPPEVMTKLARLRAELKAANNCTEEFMGKQRWKDARTSWNKADKLATEINLLTSRTSAYELKIANSLWLEKSYPIETNFISALEPNYGTVLFPVDFKNSPEPTRLQINQWVAEQTNDRIQDLLPSSSINPLTRLVIANSVYFKGDWAQPFISSYTRPERFHQANDRSIEIPMMHQWNGISASYGAFQSDGELFPTPHEIKFELKDDDPSLYPDSNGNTMLALDYQGRKIQMVFLVPQSADGILELEKSLTHENLQRWIGLLEQRLVDITIPKYNLKLSYELSKTLRSLGMNRPFGGPEESQFDAMSPGQEPDDRLRISHVQHKTYIDVSEIGTEAAAATAVGMSAEAGDFEEKTRPFHPIFKADKPFIFLIRDRETASILFMGRYVGPKD